ncbi:MAG TPA: hypothetical protein VJT09_12210 [Pyrinomonadaceae bacterium]|nr:hypothetical protein [Pyrinomonadaceae bacterium]
MREAKFSSRLFPHLILVLGLFPAAWPKAQGQVRSETEPGVATIFWDSKDSRGPRWDLSEEPGLFLYLEQLKAKRPNDKLVYIARGPLGEVAWYLLAIRDWLINTAGVKRDLVFTFDGGREKELRYQAWLVPEGAEMPGVAALPPEDENSVIEFTHYPYQSACEYCGIKGGFTLSALAEELRKRPGRKAYLEFFPCNNGVGRGRFTAARREASEAKRILIKQGGIASSRVLVKMKDDRQRGCEARIWLLPLRPNSSPGR